MAIWMFWDTVLNKCCEKYKKSLRGKFARICVHNVALYNCTHSLIWEPLNCFFAILKLHYTETESRTRIVKADERFAIFNALFRYLETFLSHCEEREQRGKWWIDSISSSLNLRHKDLETPPWYREEIGQHEGSACYTESLRPERKKEKQSTLAISEFIESVFAVKSFELNWLIFSHTRS